MAGGQGPLADYPEMRPMTLANQEGKRFQMTMQSFGAFPRLNDHPTNEDLEKVTIVE